MSRPMNELELEQILLYHGWYMPEWQPARIASRGQACPTLTEREHLFYQHMLKQVGFDSYDLAANMEAADLHLYEILVFMLGELRDQR